MAALQRSVPLINYVMLMQTERAFSMDTNIQYNGLSHQSVRM